ncbi:NF-X1-type zinc finger protein [Planoprotostelium fungivorum]|uniref:NF-X1-type zinc finger protein n=1 Tax=Planoprotostelium fungivorum TaxID=1890364 RepID=A0A2P6NW15_9EUKA|nr:NF-X1-type zinc finger protein [Planoprotostelium fungivorum]
MAYLSLFPSLLTHRTLDKQGQETYLIYYFNRYGVLLLGEIGMMRKTTNLAGSIMMEPHASTQSEVIPPSGFGRGRRGRQRNHNEGTNEQAQEQVQNAPNAQTGSRRGRGRGARNPNPNNELRNTNGQEERGPPRRRQPKGEKGKEEATEHRQPIVEGHLAKMVKEQQNKWSKDEEGVSADKKPQQRERQVATHFDFSAFSEDTQEVVQQIISQEYECMICCDVIKKQMAVWHCGQCYRLFHVFCMKKWATSNSDKESNGHGKQMAFRCPNCQYVHVERIQYTCYCTKTTQTRDPAYRPDVIPHSCGDRCGRKRKDTDCPHGCVELCHPGACPPCMALSPKKKCFCGKLEYRTRCGDKETGKSCGGICNAVLSCGLHRCKEVCHSGPCQPCTVPQKQECYCGKEEKTRDCGSGVVSHRGGRTAHYSCGRPCDSLLECGNHRCKDVCHAGPCDPCETSPKVVKNCPCGKIPLEFILQQPRKSCLDPIPVCANRCDMLLSCGRHRCTQNCHHGACPPCQAVISAPCRCHSTTQKKLCSESDRDIILCGKHCKSQRNCGRHKCGVICCSSSPKADPQGIDVEGNHICPLMCNRKLKCGRHSCDMLCHAGPCPPCHVTSHEPYICECGHTRVEPPILCNQKLPECEHICVRPRPCGHANMHKCHPRETECPPCTVLCSKMCVGGHDVRNHIPCHINECGKPLSCGIHVCKRTCHSGPCILGMAQNAGNDHVSCGGVCGIPRELCAHLCAVKCHPHQPCPKVPCKVMIALTCPCKRKTVKTECMRGGEEDTAEKGKIRELMCDEICEKQMQNKRLADALGITQKSVKRYPDDLQNFARVFPSFVNKVEKMFEEFIKSRALRYEFAAMDRVQRKIVHELAPFYGLLSESICEEPDRRVVITRGRDTGFPDHPLSSLVDSAKFKLGSMSLVNTAPSFPLEVGEIPSNVNKKTFLSFIRKDVDASMHMQWIDESTVVCFFRSQATRRAAHSILKGGQFTVCDLKDQEPVDNTADLISDPYSSRTVTPKSIDPFGEERSKKIYSTIAKSGEEEQTKRDKERVWSEGVERDAVGEAEQLREQMMDGGISEQMRALDVGIPSSPHLSWEDDAVN